MLSLLQQNQLPGPNEEGATGKLDNKGAIFIPGGLIYRDMDDKQISYEPLGSLNEAVFRQKIRESMHYDNASLLFPDGLAKSVNFEPFKNHKAFKERDSVYTEFLLLMHA